MYIVKVILLGLGCSPYMSNLLYSPGVGYSPYMSNLSYSPKPQTRTPNTKHSDNGGAMNFVKVS